MFAPLLRNPNPCKNGCALLIASHALAIFFFKIGRWLFTKWSYGFEKTNTRLYAHGGFVMGKIHSTFCRKQPTPSRRLVVGARVTLDRQQPPSHVCETDSFDGEMSTDCQWHVGVPFNTSR